MSISQGLGGGGGHKISAVLSKYPSLMSLQLHSHMICLLEKKRKKKTQSFRVLSVFFTPNAHSWDKRKEKTSSCLNYSWCLKSWVVWMSTDDYMYED